MIAVDTNVLIYACDQSDPRRQQIALDLIATSRNGMEILCSEDVPGFEDFESVRVVNPFN